MNAIGYDAAALGNHEYNYGLDTLRAFEDQCDHPLLSANSVDWDTGQPIFTPYVLKTIVPAERPVTVGILGLVTPGVAIWDATNVEGKVRFPGIVEQAKVMVPRMKAAGADIVVVSCHSGSTTSSSYGDALPLPRERQPAARRAGARHRRDPRRPRPRRGPGAQGHERRHRSRGAAQRAALLGHAGQRHGPRPRQAARPRLAVAASSSTLLNANTVPEDAEIAALVRPAHEKVLTYVNSVIGTLHAGDVGLHLALRGHRGDGLHQPRPGRRRSRRPWPARRTPASRCSRSPRPSTRTPRSRRARSPCATSRGSTSSTTRCSASP